MSLPPKPPDFTDEIWTEHNLANSVRATRQHRGGVPLTRVAEIMAEELCYAELKALSEHLARHSIKRKVGKIN